MSERGPYMNEAGDWWFPVDCWGWNEAQKAAAMFARESDCVTRYQGIKVDVPLYEDDDEDGTMRTAYHFQDVDPFALKERDSKPSPKDAQPLEAVKHPSHPAQGAEMSSEGDTPEARLAAAIRTQYAPPITDERIATLASAILLADPTIARHMALGAAVEQWFDQNDFSLTVTPSPEYGYIVFGPGCGSDGFCPGHPTLTAAIDAALRDPEEAEHE